MTLPQDAPLADAAEPPRPVCATCGASAADDGRAALTWSMSFDRGRTAWTCPDCARRHVRAIEGKLDADWW